MDSSKLPQGSDECSSNESGWTAYIGSPGQEDDHDDDDDQDSSKDEVRRDEEDAGSDDSMASDASSGPSNPFRHLNKQLGCKYAKNYDIERKNGGKKEQKHDEKVKAAKDKAGSATRSRKK